MNADYAQLLLRVRRGCTLDKNNGIGFFRAASLIGAGGVRHGFTARFGGVSPAPYDSLNLCFARTAPKDSRENVSENFRRMAAAAGIEYAKMTVVNFEHGTNVLAVTMADAGRGFDPGVEPLPFCDGLVTNEPGLSLVTNHADCGAFFVYDPVKRAAGIAHAGWKGALGRIGARVVSMMTERYGSDPRDMIASNGPCICGRCYEVDTELAERFADEFHSDELYSPGKPGKAYLDLEAAQAIQLIDAGIPPESITLMEKCTYESPETLFSYRRDGKPNGDMAGFITLG